MVTDSTSLLTAQDLLAGACGIHDIKIEQSILTPGKDMKNEENFAGVVRLKPLSMGVLGTIARAAKDDPGLIPVLMIKQSLVEPVLTVDQIRQLHIGLIHFLVRNINLISGLSEDGQTIDHYAQNEQTKAYLMLAKHFGWTPEQVSQLTPGQIAIYLSGIENLLHFQQRNTNA